MKNTNFKGERGITLIALVITIIVLLILAGASISMLAGDNGLLKQAQLAATESEKAAEAEKDILSSFDYELAKSQKDPAAVGKTQDEYILAKKYGAELGDTVNYNAGVDGYDGGWKVLGVEGNKVLLLSTKMVEKDFELKGIDGYNNGISKLNAVCAPYGKGTGAVGARSLKAEDIHEIVDYDPSNNPYTGKPQNDGKTYEYGNVGTYTVSNGKVTYIGSNGTSGDGDAKGTTSFMQVDKNGEFLADNVEYKAKNNWFSYLIGPMLTEGVDGDYIRILTDKKEEENREYKEFNMLKGQEEVADSKYWLATQTVMTKEYGVSWGLADLQIEATTGWGFNVTRNDHLFNSRYASVEHEKASQAVKLNVRAVVMLDEDVTLKKQADGSFNIE